MNIRGAIGNKLVQFGEATREIAPEFGATWDPYRQAGMENAALNLGKMVEYVGRVILPQVESND